MYMPKSVTISAMYLLLTLSMRVCINSFARCLGCIHCSVPEHHHPAYPWRSSRGRRAGRPVDGVPFLQSVFRVTQAVEASRFVARYSAAD